MKYAARTPFDRTRASSAARSTETMIAFGRQRQSLAEAAPAFADQPVPRPDARRLHRDQNLARPGHRTGNLVEPHGVDAAVSVNSNGSHPSSSGVEARRRRSWFTAMDARRHADRGRNTVELKA
jgi:hypothetical protein